MPRRTDGARPLTLRFVTTYTTNRISASNTDGATDLHRNFFVPNIENITISALIVFNVVELSTGLQNVPAEFRTHTEHILRKRGAW